MSQRFERHIYAVQHYTALTAPRYAALFDSHATIHPICCFGNPEKARGITVGVNPSKGEFHARRRWPAEMSHTDLAKRCRDYFTGSEPPHDWFAPWSKALRPLNLSYGDGTAAHVDLSPRATKFVSEFKEAWEQALFLEMVERDLWTFFGTLALCPEAKIILIAGSVTGRYYINEFLQRFAPDYGYSLDGPFNRLAHRGPGKTAFHTLSGGDRPFPVFFCSTSPSARDKELLPHCVKNNAHRFEI